MIKPKCANCKKKSDKSKEYELRKAEGSDAGHWYFCSDTCLYLWLIHYNKLLPLIAQRET